MLKFGSSRQPWAVVSWCGFVLAFIFHAATAAPYNARLGTIIDSYLQGKNSPIASNGAVFFDSGVGWNIDPRLIAAIAGAESSFGTVWQACPANGYNAWSWFYGGTCANSPFSSFADGIQTVTKFMRKSYLNKGYRTIPQIETKYCASGCSNWASNVSMFYTQIPTNPAGNLGDLSFPAP
jgi:hypothetical protein